jgi:MFS family permease
MIASSYTLACWVSSTVYMFIGQPLGRRRTLLLGDAFVIVGGSLQASSWSVPQIIIARVLCGFGIGLVSCAVITYMSEMSTTKADRGREAAIQSSWLIGGVAFGLYHTPHY